MRLRLPSLFLLVLFLAQWAVAATRYVRTDGNNSNSGTANTAGGAWQTIDFAAGAVSGGDVVRVAAGTYPEIVTPNVNNVTFVADGPVNVDGISYASGMSGIRWIEFTFDADVVGGAQSACVAFAGTTGFMEFWHCTLKNADDNGFRGANPILTTNLVTVGCVFDNFGIDGGAFAISIPMFDCFLLANRITNCRPDGIFMAGKRVRILNTHFSGMSEADGGHTDLYQTGSGGNSYGWEGYLVESTFQVGSGTQGDEHVLQASHGQAPATDTMHNNIFRGNVWHNNGTGGLGINQTSVGGITNIFIYGNTHVLANRAPGSAGVRYGDTVIGTLTDWIFYKNHILYEVWADNVSVNLEVVLIEVSNFEKDYNLAFSPDSTPTYHSTWTGQVNELSNVNPEFIDVANRDFRLGATSGARNAGGPLTTVTTANGSGTTFAVGRGGNFRADNLSMTQYGGNLIKGDTITVGTDVLEIASIDGNNITVTTSFTWAQNDPVYWGSDNTPDMGALPFGHTKLTSATANNGTVTPNGDTRMVVQFREKIPIAVDNTSPFTFSHQSGDVYRAYALYASETLFVEAVDASAPVTSIRGNKAGQSTGTGGAF